MVSASGRSWPSWRSFLNLRLTISSRTSSWSPRRVFFRKKCLCIYIFRFGKITFSLWLRFASRFVRLSVCLKLERPTGHTSKPIIMKLYQVVEVVSTEKHIDFEVKGHLEVKFLKLSFFIWLTLNLNKICIFSLNLETNYFWVPKDKGQLKLKLLK